MVVSVRGVTVPWEAIVKVTSALRAVMVSTAATRSSTGVLSGCSLKKIIAAVSIVPTPTINTGSTKRPMRFIKEFFMAVPLLGE
jgi:hypothetical protein